MQWRADRQTQTKGWRIICAVSCHAPRECAHGWVGRRREEGVARMLDRSRICIARPKTARAMAFACRKTHASLRLVLRPLSASVLSRRPSPLSNPSCSTAGCHTTPTLCCRAAPAPCCKVAQPVSTGRWVVNTTFVSMAGRDVLLSLGGLC